MEEITYSAIVLVVVLAASAFFQNWSCGSKWARSGFDSDWGPIQGCMIRVSDNKWIPEERYRELDN